MFTYVQIAASKMREAPSEESKVVSEALFAELVECGAQVGEFVHIATPDHYAGWVKRESLVTRSSPYVGQEEITRLSAHVYAEADTEYGPKLTLSFGSRVVVMDASDARWVQILLPDGQRAFLQKGDIAPLPVEDLAAFSQRFLGLPYTWGGRSSFGYDCSGFVQMVYARRGILLPRDAHLQMKDPRCVKIALEEIAPGDLLFFGKSEQVIGHVGICLNANNFIHATSKENLPYLRMSPLSQWVWNAFSEYPYRAARRIITR